MATNQAIRNVQNSDATIDGQKHKKWEQLLIQSDEKVKELKVENQELRGQVEKEEKDDVVRSCHQNTENCDEISRLSEELSRAIETIKILEEKKKASKDRVFETSNRHKSEISILRNEHKREMNRISFQLQEAEKHMDQFRTITKWLETRIEDLTRDHKELEEQKRDEVAELMEMADDFEEEQEIKKRQMKKMIGECRADLKWAIGKLQSRKDELHILEADVLEQRSEMLNRASKLENGNELDALLEELKDLDVLHIKWENDVLRGNTHDFGELLNCLTLKHKELEAAQKENERQRKIEKYMRILKTKFIDKINVMSVNLDILVSMYPRSFEIKAVWNEITNFNAFAHIENVEAALRKLLAGQIDSDEEIEEYPGALFMKQYNEWIAKGEFKKKQRMIRENLEERRVRNLQFLAQEAPSKEK